MPPKNQQGTARGSYSSLANSNPRGIGTNGTGGISNEPSDVGRGVGSSRALSGLQSSNSSASSASVSSTNQNLGTRVTANLSSNDQLSLNRRTGVGKNSNPSQSANSRLVQDIDENDVESVLNVVFHDREAILKNNIATKLAVFESTGLVIAAETLRNVKSK